MHAARGILRSSASLAQRLRPSLASGSSRIPTARSLLLQQQQKQQSQLANAAFRLQSTQSVPVPAFAAALISPCANNIVSSIASVIASGDLSLLSAGGQSEDDDDEGM